MKFYYGVVLFFWLIIDGIITVKINTLGTISILIALCLFVIKEKFFDNWITLAVFTAVLGILSIRSGMVFILFGIVLVDLAYMEKYIFAFAVMVICAFAATKLGTYQLLLPVYAGSVFGYVVGQSDKREKKYITLLDNERNLRYQLEKTQLEMVNLQNEIEHITEVRERNRIAQEIHDNIGHSIAGVLFQLQAADKLISSNTGKAEKILKLCIEKLSEALETTRNTVFNIKSDQTAGIDRIKKIINGFRFCNLEFEHAGDFNSVSSSKIKMLEDTTKEVLTNAMKYSCATNISLKISVNKKHIRFYYKDNGVGCTKIVESVGLSSLKERVNNLDGTYSIDGNNGFTIVYTIPNINAEADI